MSDTLSPAQKDGIGQILRVMETHRITIGDIRKSYALEKKERKTGTKELNKSELIMRLFVYLGGTMIFAGLGVFINTIWDDIGSLPRVVITFGSGFTAYLCGLVFANDKRFANAATPAFILAFLLQPFGLFVLLKEYFDGGNEALGSMVVFGPLMMQQALTFLKFRRSALLLFSLLYLIGFAGATVEYFDFNRGCASLLFGLFLFFVTADMQMRQKFRDLTPVFFIIGSVLLLAGVYYYIGRTMFDPLALCIILGMLWFAVEKGSKTLYVMAMIYIAAYYCGGPGGGWKNWGYYNNLTAIMTGASLALAGQWLKNTNYISLFPLWLFIGTAYALGGAYGLMHGTTLEPAYIALPALGIYGSLLLRSRAVLAAAVLMLIGFIAAYSAEHFANTPAWPLVLIFIGIVILAAGFLFARLSGRIKNAAAV